MGLAPPYRLIYILAGLDNLENSLPGLPQEPGSRTINNSEAERGDSDQRPESAGWACLVCARTFPSKIGLGLHKRKAHPVLANKEAAPKMVKRRWSDEELALLASTEAQLVAENGSCSNLDLLAKLPHLNRTVEAIKGQRRYQKYRNLVQQYLATVPEVSPIPVMFAAGGSASAADAAAQPADSPGDSGDSMARPVNEPSVAVPAPPGVTETVSELLARAAQRKSYQGLTGKAARRLPKTGFDKRARSAKISKKTLRRIEYARVQGLYKKSRGRAAAEVIDGQCRVVEHSLDELEAYWRPIFEAVSGARGPTPEVLEAARRKGQYGGAEDRSRLWDPITIDEVRDTRLAPGTAPGPDGIRSDEWNKVPEDRKAEIFNLWLTNGDTPEPLRQCRTIFVPKKDSPGGPGDYRPISIASIPLRHLHAILARRLLACCPPDPRQRGFIRADGTLENTAVLDAVLGDCRKKLKECHVATLDFSKAFDTVSHKALLELLRARGLPEAFVSYIARLYESATTILAAHGNTSEPVRVGKGVRQGDPLSPMLFNIVMDSVLDTLPSYVGYRLEGVPVSGLAYADDVVLVTGSKAGMREVLERVGRCAETLGLRVNHSKSSVLSMVPDGHRKKLHYLEEKSFGIGRRKLRQATCVERWRYLGVDYQATGCVTLEHDITEALNNITRAPLKPQQRLELVRGHLVQRFMHGFVLGKISDDRLRMLDVQIRSAVRKWLRLPKDVPTAYFHANCKDGGLGVPSLRAVVPSLIIKRYGALGRSTWEAARAAASSAKILSKLRWARKQMGKFTTNQQGGSSNSETTSTTDFWRENLYGSVDGFELRESSKTAASTAWLRERSGRYTGRDYMQFVHTHINALPSRVRATRGRREDMGVELNCRAGCKVRETTAHVIQQCHRTHGGRIDRHDLVVRVVSKEMTRLGWQVEVEPKIATSLGTRKPDIIAIKGGDGVIWDAQIVSGQRSLDEAHRAKRSKYGTHKELVEKVADKLGLPIGSVHVTTCTLSWRGIWSRASLNEQRRLLGLGSSLFMSIPELVLRGSHTNWTRFNQLTTAKEKGEP